MDERMMAFQREGVQFALRRGGRVLIGDEMGLGKTVQACALLKCYEDEVRRGEGHKCHRDVLLSCYFLLL
jgi:SNF2 family DNA or RNA helicase